MNDAPAHAVGKFFLSGTLVVAIILNLHLEGTLSVGWCNRLQTCFGVEGGAEGIVRGAPTNRQATGNTTAQHLLGQS